MKSFSNRFMPKQKSVKDNRRFSKLSNSSPQGSKEEESNEKIVKVPSPLDYALPPHSSRDLNTAMDYLERYHSSFDGSILTQPISESISNQVDLLIATSKRMETPNFFFFDKCPTAIIYFLRNYLETLEQPLIEQEQVQNTFRFFTEIDPLVRIEEFRKQLRTNRNKQLIKHLLLFLHGIESRSSSPKITLDCLIKLFSGCIFRLPEDCDKNLLRKQKNATSFVIHRADVLFLDDEEEGGTREERTGILSVQFASRRVGTDGMLFLLERELQKISDELQDLDYEGVSSSFGTIKSELLTVSKNCKTLSEKQVEFDSSFSIRLQEVKGLVDQCEPTYNHLDFHSSIANFSDEEEDE